jgi:23S rRNA pseudouridine955/2504/2580 synthase
LKDCRRTGLRPAFSNWCTGWIGNLGRAAGGEEAFGVDRAARGTAPELTKAQSFEKRYLALVKGAWPEELREVNAPLRKGKAGNGLEQVAVDDEGRYAKSLFRVMERFDGEATLVEIRLLTGRTHQARVHATHAGHPIAGDDKYGDWDWNARLRKLGLRRLFLHAAGLAFPHPDW